MHGYVFPYVIVFEVLIDSHWTSMCLLATLVCRHSVSLVCLFCLGDFSRFEECTYSEVIETIRPLIADILLISALHSQSPFLVFTFMRVAVFICRSQTAILLCLIALIFSLRLPCSERHESKICCFFNTLRLCIKEFIRSVIETKSFEKHILETLIAKT